MALRRPNAHDNDRSHLEDDEIGPVAVETREERIRRAVESVNRAYGGLNQFGPPRASSRDIEREAFTRAVAEEVASSLEDDES